MQNISKLLTTTAIISSRSNNNIGKNHALIYLQNNLIVISIVKNSQENVGVVKQRNIQRKKNNQSINK